MSSRTLKGSLIDRMGGAEASSGFIILAVEIFHSKLIADPVLHRFFEGKDHIMLRKKQAEFLAYVFGGPKVYAGKGILEAHEHLIRDHGLNEVHFDIVAEHFRDTLVQLGATEDLINEAISILNSARPIFQGENRAQNDQPADNKLDDISTHRGDQSTSFIAARLQELLLSSDDKLEKSREEIRKLVGNVSTERMHRLKGALRMRGPGLSELLDQALN